MKKAKSIITESRDAVNDLLREPSDDPVERLQYKVMAHNLNHLLRVLTWLVDMRHPKRTR